MGHVSCSVYRIYFQSIKLIMNVLLISKDKFILIATWHFCKILKCEILNSLICKSKHFIYGDSKISKANLKGQYFHQEKRKM